MDISKTLFKEYSKCQRAYPLQEIYQKKLNEKVNLYDEDRKEKILEILSYMFDENGDDLINTTDSQIEAMLPFYQDVERVALDIASKVFGQKFQYFENTRDQKCFSFTDENGYRFYCYLDGYWENEKEAIVIEVKSISSSKIKKIGFKEKGKFYPLFTKTKHIYSLVSSKDWKLDEAKYQKGLAKLLDIKDDVGKYVYDLAIERYIIENSSMVKNKNIKYYLALLNADFVMEKDGQYYGNDSVINFIDLTDITYLYLNKIANIKEEIVKNILENKLVKPTYNEFCGFNGKNRCPFFKICWKEYCQYGSILDYMGNKIFYTENGKKMVMKDLVDCGYKGMDDIPISWIKNPNQIIQRKCFDENKEYIDKEKIALGLTKIVYPIYHLDFEAFNAPLPRFFGEKPFSQSVFQFSIHKEIENEKIDLKRNYHGYVASSFSDEREELVKDLIKTIDLKNGGTVLVYNQSFEYNRIKEFIGFFPQYKEELELILKHMIDLENIVHVGSKFYKNLGVEKEKEETINFYNNSQCGKYSIKKLLPVFSNLSYHDLNIYNGVIASSSYARFRYLLPEEIENIRKDLIEYCRQDTWSMVVILDGLKQKIK